MQFHKVRCETQYFEATERGDKLFEVRRNDRNYLVGDTLELTEVKQGGQFETGRSARYKITYRLPGGQFGIDPTYCVLGIAPVDKNESN